MKSRYNIKAERWREMEGDGGRWRERTEVYVHRVTLL